MTRTFGDIAETIWTVAFWTWGLAGSLHLLVPYPVAILVTTTIACGVLTALTAGVWAVVSILDRKARQLAAGTTMKTVIGEPSCLPSSSADPI